MKAQHSLVISMNKLVINMILSDYVVVLNSQRVKKRTENITFLIYDEYDSHITDTLID